MTSFRPALVLAKTRATAVGVVAGLAAAIVSAALVPMPAGIFGAGLAVLMSAIAIIDRREFIIPDWLNFCAFVLGIGYCTTADNLAGFGLVESLLRGGITGLCFLGVRAAYLQWRQREGLGLGDVKLAVVAGIWLEWSVIPIAVELAALFALSAYILEKYVAGSPLQPTHRVPFGFYFAPIIWVTWLCSALYEGTANLL